MVYVVMVIMVIVIYAIIERICQCIETVASIEKGYVSFENIQNEEKKDV